MPVKRSLILMMLLAACQAPTLTPFVSPSASPILASPVATPEALTGPTFELSPLRAGDTVVAGHGPVGVPITIVDVTLSAKPLAHGVIDDTGSFSLNLSEPAIGGRLIGIQVTDLASTRFQDTNTFAAQLDAKAGPGFRYYPQIGAVYASTIVAP